MIQAVGIHSSKVYIIGSCLEEVIRKMNEYYPCFEKNNGERERDKVRSPILPEPMKLYEEE